MSDEIKSRPLTTQGRDNYDTIFRKTHMTKSKSTPISVLPQEYRIVSDDDGHYYVIPVGHEQVFQHWVDAMTKGSRHLPANFEPIRVDGPHTVVFTGWREVT